MKSDIVLSTKINSWQLSTKPPTKQPWMLRRGYFSRPHEWWITPTWRAAKARNLFLGLSINQNCGVKWYFDQAVVFHKLALDDESYINLRWYITWAGLQTASDVQLHVKWFMKRHWNRQNHHANEVYAIIIPCSGIPQAHPLLCSSRVITWSDGL